MTRALAIIAAMALSGCLAVPVAIPKPATVCGPLRGLVAEITASSAEDVRNACALFTAINGK